ncbi:hypothetical protein AgCh_035510 [Apium graveolens]
MARLRRTARKSVPGGPYRGEGFRLPEQVVVFLSEKALSQKVRALLIDSSQACNDSARRELGLRDLSRISARFT